MMLALMVFPVVVDDEEVSSGCESNHNDCRYTNTEANVMRTNALHNIDSLDIPAH
jgi:hypothetical protein